MTEKEFYAQVGKRVRRLRERANLTQEDICKETGIDQSSLSQFERYGKKISAYRMKQIFDALGVSGSILDEGASEDEARFVITQKDVSHLNGNTLEKVKEIIKVLLSPGDIIEEVARKEEEKAREKRSKMGNTANGYTHNNHYQGS